MPGRLLQRELQQISKGRNSGFWVAPKIYLFGATKTLDRITERGYNNVHQVRRTHKNAEGEIKMEKIRKMTQQEVDVMCKKHEAWLASGGKEAERADFGGADLRGMSFKGKNLEEANFKFADLTAAFMQGANLSRANLEGTQLTFVRAAHAKFDDCKADFACFEEARLAGASFNGASLQSASFNDAIINFVSFAEADLRRASFLDAVTGGTEFATAQIDRAAFNSGIGGNFFDDKQIAEFAYHLCNAVLQGSTNSPEVKDEVRKILSLANRAGSVKIFGRVQEYRNGQYVTAKEAE